MDDQEETSEIDENPSKKNEEDSVKQSIYNDLLIGINKQLESTSVQVEPVNIFELFVCNIFGFDDASCIEDSSIFIDGRISQFDRFILSSFVTEVTNLFDSTFGINVTEPNISIIYSLYKSVCLNVTDIFTYYLCGLSKLDIGYKEEIPNYEELSYEYYVNKLYKDDSKDVYSKVRGYVDYIISNYIITNNYFEIALLESSGNIDLSNIFIEQSNFRITYDDPFFVKKVSKILSSEDVIDTVVDKFIDINNLIS